MQTKTQTALWRRKLWVGFVFLGMGFGVNAWAVCEAEIQRYAEANVNGIALTCKFMGRSGKDCIVPSPGKIQSDRQAFGDKRIQELKSESPAKLQEGIESSLLYIQRQKAGEIDGGSNQDAMHNVNICELRYVQSQLKNGVTNISTNPSNSQSPSGNNPLQSETQQSQQRARDNQARADQDAQRKGKRSHDPAAEAHECVDVDASGSYGGLVNKCNYPIEVQYCNFRPKKDSWAAQLECGKSGGLTTVGAGRTSANHVKNTETVFFFACKKPALPSDVTYVEGKGLSGRCR